MRNETKNIVGVTGVLCVFTCKENVLANKESTPFSWINVHNSLECTFF